MSNWADLPEDLLSLILSNVFGIKDRCNSKLVCKSWNSVALVSPCRQTPCLMFYQSSKRLWKFFKYNGFFPKSFPQLDNAEILCSNHGWLLMSRNRFFLFFFNPSNSQIFEVPKLHGPHKYYNRFCFFHPPTSSNCIIVGFLSNLGVRIGVLKWGENNWNNYVYNYTRPFVLSVCSPILHGGLLYILDVEGNVGTFNIEEQSTWTIHANCLLPVSLRVKLRKHFLIKLDGEEEEEEAILAVFVYGDGKKVKVYKLLKPDMKWELVKDLGNKMLYVSRTASFAETAPLTSMANKIYFPYLHDDDDSVVYYSLGTQKYHSFGGKYSLDPRKYHSFGGKYFKGKYNDLRETFATWITNISPK